MTETRWWQYTQRVIGTDTAQDAARRAGFDKSAFTRWKKGSRADPDFVVKFARAYEVNVLEALVEAEVITDEEAALRNVTPTPREMLEHIGNQELALEFVRRLGGVHISEDDTPDTVDAKVAVLKAAGAFGTPLSADVVLDDARQSDYAAVADTSPDEDDPDHDESHWDA